VAKQCDLRKNIALMTTVAVLYFASRGVVVPISSLYAESLGASYAAIGLLGTVSALTMIVFSAVWGRASDRVGSRKPILVPGLAALGISYGLVSRVSGYRMLFPLYVLAAIAQAAYDSTGLALVGDLLEQRAGPRGRRMGTYRGLCSLGFGVLAFFSGAIAERLSFQASYLITAGLLGLASLLASQVDESRGQLQDRDVEKGAALSSAGDARDGSVPAMFSTLASRHLARRVTGNVRHLLRTEREARLPLLPLLISMFLWSLVTGAVYAVWANYMVRELSYTPAQMSRLWALASLSELPLMILAGWLSDRIGRLPMLSLGFVAWALVFVGYVVVPQMPWIMLVQLARGFAYSAFTATALTYAAEVREKAQRGQVSGLYASAGGIGSILGASMGGGLTEATGFRVMIGVCAALIFSGAVYLAVAARRMASRSGANADPNQETTLVTG